MARTRRLRAILEAEDRASARITGLKATLGALGAAAAAVGAVQIGRKLVSGIQAAVKASAVQEKAEIQLQQALRNTGETSVVTLDRLKSYAGTLQDLTGVGDELILKNQALLVSIGQLSSDALPAATKAALDLAAGIGVDQRTAFDLVAKAASGYTGTLSRYGIILDKTIPEGEKFEEVLRLINEQFGGQAATQLQTFEGRLGEFQGRLGDLQEAIGGPFREVLTDVFGTVLSPFIKDLTDGINNTDAYRTAILQLGLSFAQLGLSVSLLFEQLQKVIGPIVKIGNLARLSGQSFQTFAADANKELTPLQQSLQDLITLFEDRLANTGAQIEQGITNPFKAAADAAKQARDEVRALNRETEKREQKTESLEEQAKRLIEPLTTIEEIQRETVQTSSELPPVLIETEEGFLRARAAANTLGQTIENKLGKIAAQSVANLGAQLVGAAIDGNRAWADFFKNFLRQMAIAIAQAIILRAIMTSIGFGFFGGGAGAGAGTGASGGSGLIGIFKRGGIVGAQSGFLVPGIQRGRDSVPLLAQPGEAVLPKELTDFLLQAAASGSAGSAVDVRVTTDIPAFVDVVNNGVRRGTVRVVASELTNSRAVR